VVEGYSHRITAKALEARGLIVIDGRRQTWSATTTDAGRALLERNVAPPDQSVADATAFVQAVLDAGGVVTTEDRRDGPADARLLAKALDAPNRPFGKKLASQQIGGWVSNTTEWYLATHFSDFVARRPVPSVTATRSYHPVVAAYRDNRDDHRVSKEHLQRAALVLQALAAEADRRGYGVALPSAVKLRQSGSRSVDVNGQLAIVIGENVFGIAVSELAGKGGSRMPYQPNMRLPAWQRARKFSFVPTGRLELSITNWSPAQRRSNFKDTRTVAIETFLSDVMFEIEVQALEADAEHTEVARKAADRQSRWEHAMATAKASLHESRRVEVLRSQLAREAEATAVRGYVAAARANHAGSHSAEWLDWAAGYADKIDPLGKPLLMPSDLPFAADDLKPFLGGWSPYGP
jgi:hypothetical protein